MVRICPSCGPVLSPYPLDFICDRFKLHLRPKSLGEDDVSRHIKQIPSLPPGKTIVSVFGDYFRYLYRCTQKHIEEHYQKGEELWISLVPTIDFVLSHPNGWEGPQQSQMRRAAVFAGLVPDTRGGSERIHFVTEGEASLHYCISKGLGIDALKVRCRSPFFLLMK